MVYWRNASLSARHHLDISAVELRKIKPLRYLTHIILRHIHPYYKSINQFKEVSPLNELNPKFKRSSNNAVSTTPPRLMSINTRPSACFSVTNSPARSKN